MSSDEFDLKTALDDDSIPAGLRDYAKSVAKANKDLAEKVAGFEKSQRSNTLTSALRDAGVSEKLARFYPSDSAVSGEAIAGWLKDNADIFGQAVKPTDGATPITADTAVSDIAAMQAVQSATPTNQTTPTMDDKMKSIDGLKMKTAEDRAALDDYERELMQMARMALANDPYAARE